MGAGNISVLMQLLVGMLDAALARQQDLVPAERRVAVALKVDEAPLVINRGFAETMALKRSAGLETVACWQTDAQWTEREVRDQLDALFAHRVYFATASARDARDAVALTMAEFSDTVRPGIERLSSLGRPDVRLHLPKHHAIASWLTPDGRQSPFVAQTLPLAVDRERLAFHQAHQRARGARHLDDLRQPHWERRAAPAPGTAPASSTARRAAGLDEDRARPGRCHPRRPSRSTFGAGRELSRAGRARWCAQRSLGQADRVTAGARARSARPRDARADRRDATCPHHTATPALQQRAGGDDHAAAPQAPFRRGSRGTLSVPSPRRRRDPHVLRDLRGGAADARRSRSPPCAGADSSEEHVASAAPPHRACRRAGARGESRLRQARHDVHVGGWAMALAASVRRRAATYCEALSRRCSRRRRGNQAKRGPRSRRRICVCRAGARPTSSCGPMGPAG